MSATGTCRPLAGESERGMPRQPRSIPFDSWNVTVLLVVGITVFQRVIGLLRNVLFCRLLEDHELGRWAMASSFLGWAAPFVVLGIPGIFGRYSERYRQQGQLRWFLVHSAVICGVLSALAVVAHVLLPGPLARMLFNDPAQARLVATIGLVLAAVIAMNFFAEFLTSVRLNRAVSLMHLANSLLFTAASAVLLLVRTDHEQSLLMAYGLSTSLAALLGLAYTWRLWGTLPAQGTVEPAGRPWGPMLWFALWLWCGSTVANLFDVSDQFVLKHYSTLPPATVDALLGQLHAARILPGLVITVALMLGTSLLPYLIQDAETGEHARVRQRMNAVMKLAAIGFTAAAAGMHVASPLLFHGILGGRYDSGLHLMPLAFVQYTLFSLTVIAGRYLICTDRPRLGIFPLGLGLVASIVLTAAGASRFGLPAVVAATVVAHALALLALMLISQWCGMQWHRGVWIVLLLPLSLSLGGAASLGILVAVLIAGWRADWLTSPDERQQLAAAARGWERRVGDRFPWLAARRRPAEHDGDLQHGSPAVPSLFSRIWSGTCKPPSGPP